MTRSGLGSPQVVDEILSGPEYLIASGAEEFPFVLENHGIRAAKTASLSWASMPALNIFFRILSENEAELLWVEHDFGV